MDKASRPGPVSKTDKKPSQIVKKPADLLPNLTGRIVTRKNLGSENTQGLLPVKVGQQKKLYRSLSQSKPLQQHQVTASPSQSSSSVENIVNTTTSNLTLIIDGEKIPITITNNPGTSKGLKTEKLQELFLKYQKMEKSTLTYNDDKFHAVCSVEDNTTKEMGTVTYNLLRNQKGEIKVACFIKAQSTKLSFDEINAIPESLGFNELVEFSLDDINNALNKQNDELNQVFATQMQRILKSLPKCTEGDLSLRYLLQYLPLNFKNNKIIETLKLSEQEAMDLLQLLKEYESIQFTKTPDLMKAKLNALKVLVDFVIDKLPPQEEEAKKHFQHRADQLKKLLESDTFTKTELELFKPYSTFFGWLFYSLIGRWQKQEKVDIKGINDQLDIIQQRMELPGLIEEAQGKKATTTENPSTPT